MKNYKTHYLLLLSILAGALGNSISGQVGFNNPNPALSSIVDLTAYDKGLLIPRMTSSQRLAIISPANGLMVFDLNLKAFCYYDTISNPDKWMMINALKADAIPNGNVTLVTTGNMGLGIPLPIHKLDVSGNMRTSDTVMASTGKFSGTVIASGFSGNGSVPSGAIIMWSGTTPPSGWVICDGANGTPDLRGRFIVGSGANGSPAAGDINPTYTVGATGGENMHTLTKSELPKHKHTVSSTSSDNGQVTIASSPTTDTYPIVSTTLPLALYFSSTGAEMYNLPSQPTHSHAISGNSGDGTTDGLNTAAHENRPPYYVLTYIMKQ